MPFGGTSFQFYFGFTYSPDGGVTPYSGLPTSMNARNQYLLTLTNSCTAGQALEFTVQGMASGVSTRFSAQLLNGSTGTSVSASTPWSWSVIQYNPDGTTKAWTRGDTSKKLSIFPTYQVYTNGHAQPSLPQSGLMTFIALSATFQYTGVL